MPAERLPLVFLGFGIDDRAYASDDGRSKIGLGKETRARRQLRRLGRLPARDHQQADARLALIDPMRQGYAVHRPRHHHIKHHRTNVAAGVE
jgi:hypothetical protein